MPQINPFVHFNGNAEVAFLFYKSVFGGDFTILKRFKDIETLQQTLSKSEEDKIMQIALTIGEHSVLMGSDVPSFMGKVSERENRSKISIYADTEVEANRIFNELAAGGEIEVPFGHSSFGSYFGMLRDKYGIEWMINFTAKKTDIE